MRRQGLQVLAFALLFVSAAAAADQAPGAWEGDPGWEEGGPTYRLKPLTVEEWELLAEGEISSAAHAGGALTSVFLGFGLGTAIQGRYVERGWMFTVGQLAGAMMLTIGAPACPDGNCTLAYAGLAAFGGFRVWEVVDAIVVPDRHNRQVRSVRFRYEQGAPPPPRYRGFVAPAVTGDGALAGLRLRF